jgi:hypothetical protein
MAFTVYLEHDGSETSLGTLTGTSRAVQTFPVNKAAKEFSIRIAGTEEEWLTVYEICVDVEYGEEQSM